MKIFGYIKPFIILQIRTCAGACSYIIISLLSLKEQQKERYMLPVRAGFCRFAKGEGETWRLQSVNQILDDYNVGTHFFY